VYAEFAKLSVLPRACTECHYAECLYAECHYNKRLHTQCYPVLPSLVMSKIMLSVIMLCVDVLIVKRRYTVCFFPEYHNIAHHSECNYAEY
jgi:hypothetical protein